MSLMSVGVVVQNGTKFQRKLWSMTFSPYTPVLGAEDGYQLVANATHWLQPGQVIIICLSLDANYYSICHYHT